MDDLYKYYHNSISDAKTETDFSDEFQQRSENKNPVPIRLCQKLLTMNIYWKSITQYPFSLKNRNSEINIRHFTTK